MSEQPIIPGSVRDPEAGHMWPGRMWVNGKWRTPGHVDPEPEPKKQGGGGLIGGPPSGPPPTEW